MKGEMHTVISSGGYRSRLMQGQTVSRQWLRKIPQAMIEVKPYYRNPRSKESIV
jgi:hypothetical protein